MIIPRQRKLRNLARVLNKPEAGLAFLAPEGVEAQRLANTRFGEQPVYSAFQMRNSTLVLAHEGVDRS